VGGDHPEFERGEKGGKNTPRKTTQKKERRTVGKPQKQKIPIFRPLWRPNLNSLYKKKKEHFVAIKAVRKRFGTGGGGEN